MEALNEPQQRHVLTTFRHVDEVLSSALNAHGAADSPFCVCQPDLETALRERLLGQLRDLRAAMQQFLSQGGAGASSPAILESWLIRTAIVTARIDVEEIRPRHLRGYGEVPAQAAPALEKIANELLKQLAQMEAALPPPPRDSTRQG